MTSQLTVQDLRDRLQSLDLSTQGTKPLLRKRLRKALAAGSGSGESCSSSGCGSASEQQQQRGEQHKQGNDRARARPRLKHTHFLVVDVEATCDEPVATAPAVGAATAADRASGPSGATPALDGFAYPNEIIELPVVLVRIHPDADDDDDGAPPRLEVVDTFHTYVRPSLRPVLTPFCHALTGITQAQVDAAPSFPAALDKLYAFLRRHDLLREPECSPEPPPGPEHTPAWTDTHPHTHPHYARKLHPCVAWASHGPFDLRDFVPKQSWISALPYGPPAWMRGPVLDLKRAVRAYVREREVGRGGAGGGAAEGEGTPKERERESHPHGSIPDLLLTLGLGEFEGKLHCGMDDTRNLARILIKLGGEVLKAQAQPEAEAEPQSQGQAQSQSQAKAKAQAEARTRLLDTLRPNVPLAEYPPFPSADAPENKVKVGGRFYPKRWPWMGKKLGVVRWPPGAGPGAGAGGAD